MVKASPKFAKWCVYNPVRWAAISGGGIAVFLSLQFRSLVVGLLTGIAIFAVNLMISWPTLWPAKATARKWGFDLPPKHH